jgi:hypothetical protein
MTMSNGAPPMAGPWERARVACTRLTQGGSRKFDEVRIPLSAAVFQ